MIATLHLFADLDRCLIDLLRSLTEEQWSLRTTAPQWTVKDIVAHLLDGNLRTLSMLRDGYVGDPPQGIDSYRTLVEYLNRLNTEWVQAMRRVSPRILMELLEQSGQEYRAYLATLDMMAPAVWSVAWAGEAESVNWFHIAREYTEKWHHQQQIRLALECEEVLMTKKFYHPYLATSIRALPHHYRDVSADIHTTIHVHITGEGGGDWFLQKTFDAWCFVEEPPTKACRITIDGRIAWRMFTKGMSRVQAEAWVRIDGNRQLGEHIFSVLAVMA